MASDVFREHCGNKQVHCFDSDFSYSGFRYKLVIAFLSNCIITLVGKLQALLQLLDGVQPCCGNSDERFLNLSNIRYRSILT